MKPIGMAFLAVVLGLGITAGTGFAPQTAGQAIAAGKQDRAATRAARRAKRIECRREADLKKLRFIKRSRFIRNCNRAP